MDYTKLNTAQLTALQETADSEALPIIKSILESRQNPSKSTEQAPEPEPEPEPPTKMDGIQLKNETQRLKAMFEGQPCQVIPYDQDEWVDGIVMGVLPDVLHRDIKYSIKTTDGKRLIKSYQDKTVKIQERVKGCKFVEPKAEPKKETARERANNGWDPEEAIEKATRIVGCLVLFEVRRNEETGEETNIFGRIISIHTHNRNCCVMMRLKVPTGDGKYATKDRVFHEGQTLLADDEKTEVYRTSFQCKRERRLRKDNLNPTQRLQLCQRNFDKAQESLERAKDLLELRRRQLQDAEDELRNSALTK